MERKVTNYLMCASCKGKCCQRYGGGYHPNDFGKEITEEVIYNALKTYRVGVNWWDGEFEHKGKKYNNAYFLHARHRGEKPVYASWGGTCASWSLEVGCSLVYEERPIQCRMLEPKDYGDNCVIPKESKADKNSLVVAWLPYSDIVDKAVTRFQDEGLNVVPNGEVNPRLAGINLSDVKLEE
jgi:Fe-S-cluster containining protein